jgi:hypothetical protein
MFGRGWRGLLPLGVALAALLLAAPPAGAVMRGHPPARLGARSGTNTQLVLTATGPGQLVTGYIANASSGFDPSTDPYPSSPPPDFSPKDEGFAGVIFAEPPGGGTEQTLYCIDINTDTYIGFGYLLGTWDEANVPNVGFVARLLDEYYPNTDEPTNDPSGHPLTTAQTAAAVQAAVWFFSDRYVLSASDSLYPTVASIVAKIQQEGPLNLPEPPSLTITPPSQSGPAASVIGPFTVSTGSLGRRARHHRRRRSTSEATVTATGGTMYSDATGTTPIANGTLVPSGTKIWLRASAGSSTTVLQATAEATVPIGNVYLYDGDSGPSSAQKLILSKTGTLTTTVQATANFLPSGSLVVRKTIAGPAAGSQGKVVIQVDCDDGVSRDDFTIDADTGKGTTSRTYSDIPEGTTCTVSETSNGGTSATSVVVTGDGQQVTIPSGASKTVDITDTYDFVPGSLIVRKTIAGPGAGLQGAVTIHTVCDGTALTPDFVIPAASKAGDYTTQYDDIPAPTTCTVTETVDGHNSAVSVDVEGSGQTVSVPAGDIAEADISDTYGLLPGELEVTKTIAGPLAGSQGEIVVHTVCTSPNGTPVTPDFVIPALATGDQSHIYSGIPTPASCTVTETANGATSTVSAVVAGSPSTVSIQPGGSGAAHITDTYGPTPGSLLVTKTIAGPLAGHQGPVTIHVVCNGTALSPDFVIAAGTRGTVTHSFDDIPAGSVCTVNETADGASATVTATVSGDGQKVTVPAGTVVPVELMDVYEATAGSLKVIKTLAGPAAHKHGHIAILVACGGPQNIFVFRIRAHTAAGSVSREFDGLPAGSRCRVVEALIGRTRSVSVVATGRRTKVTIHANRRATAHITDTFVRRKARVTG